MRALDEIGRLPWSTFRANGDPRAIPDMLRRLATDDDAARADAWPELCERIHPQGDVYDSTIAVLPFLFAMALDQLVPTSEVMELACELAEDVEDRSLCDARCSRHTPWFVSGLASADVDERALCALTLGYLTERPASAVLEAALAREQAGASLAVIVWALGAHSDDAREHFTHTTSALTDPLAVAVASAWTIRWQGRDADERAVRVAADAVARRRAGSAPRLPFDFLDESLRSPLANRLLQQIRTGRYVLDAENETTR